MNDMRQMTTLGRSIERADMTARLLSTRALTEASGPSWTTILRSCGAYEAYLRTYRGVPHARNAAEFLLLDRLFPRSILFSVTRARGTPAARRLGHPRGSARISALSRRLRAAGFSGRLRSVPPCPSCRGSWEIRATS